jgi:hypothetical protein
MIERFGSEREQICRYHTPYSCPKGRSKRLRDWREKEASSVDELEMYAKKSEGRKVKGDEGYNCKQ